jgi:hypothetical protein
MKTDQKPLGSHQFPGSGQDRFVVVLYRVFAFFRGHFVPTRVHWVHSWLPTLNSLLFAVAPFVTFANFYRAHLEVERNDAF